VCVGVAYFRVADAAKSVVAIENAGGAINQIAPTTHEPRRRRQADAKREKRPGGCFASATDAASAADNRPAHSP
jgi:hypothetical protein